MIKIEAKESNNKVKKLEYVEPEIWKNVEGYNGDYKISNHGRVKSFKWGRPHILKKSITDKGYVKCALNKNGERQDKLVHRLVATAFIPNPENKPQVNHKNGIRDYNFYKNLEWVTQNENISHGRRFLGHKNKFRHLFNYHSAGEDHHNSKLKKDDVKEIRELYNNKDVKVKDISNMFGISRQTVRHIGKSITWKHI